MESGEDLYKDGSKITEKMTNLTIDGITGPVEMNDNNDRLAHYAILSMNHSTRLFQRSLAYSAKHKQLTTISKITWPGNCDNTIYRSTLQKKGGKLPLTDSKPLYHVQRCAGKVSATPTHQTILCVGWMVLFVRLKNSIFFYILASWT